MRSAVAVFMVSALLFVFGVGLVVVAARTAKTAPATAAGPVTTAPPVATVRQVMYGIVAPTANGIFQSVQTVVTEKGIEEIQPRTDEEWALLGSHAASLAEAGTLLMAEGRAVDRGEWIKMSQAMIDAAKRTLAAVDAKNPEAVLEAGEIVNESCDACHTRYSRQ